MSGICLLRNDMRQKLTVLISCRNERENIRSCVQAAASVADEVLVADSGSSDGTLDVVRRMGVCRLIQHEWIGYAAFKNWAIPQASHPWVLIVDADERVTPELADEIRQLLLDPPEHLDAYRIRHRTFFLGHELRYSGKNTDSACRLIRRDVCRYGQRRVHEDIDIPRHREGRLKQRFIHYEFRSYDHYFDKRVRYTKLGAEERWEQGKRTGWFGLLLRPILRFFYLYIFRRGFRDGMAGLQICMLTAFFNTFVKQARLWEMQYAIPQEEAERAAGTWTPPGDCPAEQAGQKRVA